MYKESDNYTLDSILEKILYEDMNERLSSLPSDNVAEDQFPFTKKQEKELRRLKRIMRYRKEKPAFTYIKRCVAVILLYVTSISFGLLLTDEGVRTAVGERIKEIKEIVFPLSYSAEPEDLIKEHNDDKGYHNLTFDDIPVADREAALKQFSIDEIEITYIPEGFEIRDSLKDEAALFYSYRDENNNYLLINVELSGGGDYTVASGSRKEEKISINGNNGILFMDEEECSGSILWGNEIYMVHIFGNISRQELIKVAEGIKY